MSGKSLATIIYSGKITLKGVSREPPVLTVANEGTGRSFNVTTGRIPGDSDWHDYVQLKIQGLPHKNHIAAGGGANFKNVVIDTVTGLMGYE